MVSHRTGLRPRLRAGLAAGIASLLVALLMSSPAPAEAAEAPRLSASVAQSAPDHWIDTLGDPYDLANPEDQILASGAHQNTTPRVEGGQLRWTKTTTMDVALVFAGYGPSAFAIGREGLANPIDASRYTHLSLRLRSEKRNAAAIWWDNCGPDRGRCVKRTGFIVEPGWNTYVVPLGEGGWSGRPVELRLSVNGDGTPVQMALDWARLYQPGEAVAVSYRGKNLYWDADGDRTNNHPDRPAWGKLHSGGGTATFPADAFPPGTYRFYSDDGPYSERLRVDAPAPVFDAPHEEGGADYAATVTGDAWDFRQASDVSRFGNIDEVRFADGTLHARNAAQRNDPHVFLRMGAPIDTSRYHRLTVETSLAGPFDLSHGPGGGSHGRFLWRHVGQGSVPNYYNSKELVVYPNTRRYTIDLHTNPREAIAETDDAHRRGWQGHVETFRYDPNEDPGARRWTLSEVSLRADHETVNDAFDIRWHDVSPASEEPTTVSLYYDTVRGGTRHLIASDVPQRSGDNRYRWETHTVPNGRYWITAVAQRANGTVGRSVASGPLVVRGRFDDPTVAAARIAGRDRIATAIALSRHAHANGSDAAVVAAHRGFPDAIAAAPLAEAAGGPVLLNPRDRLAAAVGDELRRLGASTIYLMGGDKAQSPAVERELAALPGVRVVRVAGASRYATAARAAELAAERWRAAGAEVTGAIVASGATFPDALSAGPWAAASAQPIVLTRPDRLSPEAEEALAALDVERVAVVGGPGAVAEAVVDELDGKVIRVYGPDRYATAEQVARRAVAAGANGHRALLASGRDFPDALAAGPAAAAGGGVLLLTGATGVPEPTRAWLTERRGAMAPLRVAGGPGAVSDATVHHLLRAAGQ